MGVYSDDKAEKSAQSAKQEAEKKEKKKPVGSEFYNTLACLVGDYFMKIGAALPPCDWKTKDAFVNMDIAGYNYGLFRYRHDLKKYPQPKRINESLGILSGQDGNISERPETVPQNMRITKAKCHTPE